MIFKPHAKALIGHNRTPEWLRIIAYVRARAKYGNPVMVFLGIVLASLVLIGSGIIIGQGLLRFIPMRFLRYITPG